MIIVAGHIEVDPSQREEYLEKSRGVLEQARNAEGCLGFSMSADLLEPGRILIFERWESRGSVDTFRGDGPSEEQGAEILSGEVYEYEIADVKSLF